jgi:hypothetical protein
LGPAGDYDNDDESLNTPNPDAGRVSSEKDDAPDLSIKEENLAEELKEDEPELNSRQLQEMRQLSGFFNPAPGSCSLLPL